MFLGELFLARALEQKAIVHHCVTKVDEAIEKNKKMIENNYRKPLEEKNSTFRPL